MAFRRLQCLLRCTAMIQFNIVIEAFSPPLHYPNSNLLSCVRSLHPIGNGTFGSVYRADSATGESVVSHGLVCELKHHSPFSRWWRCDDFCAGRNLVVKAANDLPNALEYLHEESHFNDKLCQHNNDARGRLHVAPYLGEGTINSTKYLVWEASGDFTLEDYIGMQDGKIRLATDLNVEEDDDEDGRSRHQRLAAEVLRQILEGLAYCHSLGVIHRDIKPANILVDPNTHTLRLIDFGSACDMTSWTDEKRGYRGQNKGPRSILYCAPEEFVDEEYPYAFDLYGAAVTWLRTLLCEDGLDNEGRSSFGLGHEDRLFQWRISVRDFGHNLVAWEEYAALHNELPHGWDSLFGSSRDGIRALRLLTNLMSYSPAKRGSASETLSGPYLNPTCDVDPPHELPPAMPWSVISHVQRWKSEKKFRLWREEECRLEDLFTEVVAVELGWPLGIVLDRKMEGGVIIAGIVAGSEAANSSIREGDALLAIGSIDVETASLDHVEDLINQWPFGRPIPVLLIRAST